MNRRTLKGATREEREGRRQEVQRRWKEIGRSRGGRTGGGKSFVCVCVCACACECNRMGV